MTLIAKSMAKFEEETANIFVRYNDNKEFVENGVR